MLVEQHICQVTHLTLVSSFRPLHHIDNLDLSSALLSGMVAALTPVPVIGVPVRASSLDGMDSLLSIAQVLFTNF